MIKIEPGEAISATPKDEEWEENNQRLDATINRMSSATRCKSATQPRTTKQPYNDYPKVW